MKPSQIVLWSAVTTVAGTWILNKLNVQVPGFRS